jgi:glucose/arabinose dehydrogenase
MVVATGWRNIYDVAFVPPHHPALPAGKAAVPMNGPDGVEYQQPDGSTKQRPAGEDTLSVLDVTDGVIEHYGFPWCLYDRDRNGLRGFTQDPDEGRCDPLPPAAFEGLAGPVEASRPAALFGRHVSADGLAFNPGLNFPAAMTGDLFVCLFGNFFGDETVGHKIVRVSFTRRGQKVTAIQDFMTGGLPLDLTFAPDGAMWIADFSGQILRVSKAPGL